MPQILRIGPYSIYFWSNEGDPLEPIQKEEPVQLLLKYGLPVLEKLFSAIIILKFRKRY